MFVSRLRAQVDDRSSWGDFWFEPTGVRTAAGSRVSSDSAMRLSAVFACVRVLAETMASLPFVLYRAKKGGGKDRITDHWLYDLLARNPNDWQNGFEWREMIQGHMALRGTGYNQIIANSRGEIEQLIPLHPDRVQIELLAGGGYRYRVTQQDGTKSTLAPGEVFKVAGLSSNGLTGLSVIEYARESIGAGLAQQNFAARFFDNDARPLGGWIESPNGFKDQTARETFRESWQRGQAGANRGKTAVLEGGMKYHEIGLNNKDSQFVEAQAAKVTDIARWFHMPPHLIGDLSKSTNNNIEQQSLEFVTYTMTPWAERWEAAIEHQLIGPDEGLEVEFDFENLLRGDQAARAEYYASGIANGWMTRNEVRLRENLDPLPGLNEPLQPLNMAGVSDAKPKPGKNAPPAPANDGEDPPPEDGAARRLQVLTGAIAARVVRKEVAAARKFRDAAQAAEFYERHGAYVQESLSCSEACARRWCATQLGQWKESTERDALLASWDAMAAGELAARVNTDVWTKG